jgi:SAM-dependent methyltransferase
MTRTIDTDTDTATDQALKGKHRAMWALGDYAAVAADVVAPLGPVLVEATAVRPGQRVLDIAAGSGNAAIPAAARGAQVVASDLTPELLDRGRQLAASEGVSLEWQEADAEALPYDDASFDTVLSCLGVMFAPHHQVAADEMLRVARPGGTIGLVSWTPEGFVGQMFAAMKPYAPPPPPGAQPAPLWGNEEHVRGLLGDAVRSVQTERRTLGVDAFRTPEEFRDYFKTNYGPTIAVYAAIAGDPAKVAALDEALADLGARFARPDRTLDCQTLDWEYLLVTAVRR